MSLFPTFKTAGCAHHQTAWHNDDVWQYLVGTFIGLLKKQLRGDFNHLLDSLFNRCKLVSAPSQTSARKPSDSSSAQRLIATPAPGARHIGKWYWLSKLDFWYWAVQPPFNISALPAARLEASLDKNTIAPMTSPRCSSCISTRVEGQLDPALLTRTSKGAMCECVAGDPTGHRV